MFYFNNNFILKPNNITNFCVFNDDQKILDSIVNTNAFKDVAIIKNERNKALQNADIILRALFAASFISLIISSLFLRYKKALTPRTFGRISIAGINLMANSLMVLLFAWTLSGLLKDDLKTGAYLAHLTLDNLKMLPQPSRSTRLLRSVSLQRILLAVSWLGDTPNLREYSRLNCEGLS